MSSEINVEQRTVYGKTLVYPVCEKSMAFAKLAGKKTFDIMDIKMIQFIGFEVNCFMPVNEKHLFNTTIIK